MAGVVGHFVALGDEIHKALGGRGRRHALKRAHCDGARRNREICPQRQNHAPTKSRLGKLLCHTRNTKADARERDEKVVRAELNFRLDRYAVLLEILLEIEPGACLALKENQRKCRNLLHGVCVGKIARIIRRGDKDRVRIHAVPHVIDRRVLIVACKGDVHLPGVQIVEHHMARAV